MSVCVGACQDGYISYKIAPVRHSGTKWPLCADVPTRNLILAHLAISFVRVDRAHGVIWVGIQLLFNHQLATCSSLKNHRLLYFICISLSLESTSRFISAACWDSVALSGPDRPAGAVGSTATYLSIIGLDTTPKSRFLLCAWKR